MEKKRSGRKALPIEQRKSQVDLYITNSIILRHFPGDDLKESIRQFKYYLENRINKDEI